MWRARCGVLGCCEIAVVDDMKDLFVETRGGLAGAERVEITEFGDDVVDVRTLEGGVEQTGDTETERHATHSTDHDHRWAQ